MKCLAASLLIVSICSNAFAGSLKISDWPQWHGPDRNAISPETGLLQEWPEGGPKLAWKVTGLGGGYSAASVVNGRLYGMSNQGPDEVVWARSEKDGSVVWTTPLGPAMTEGMSQGVEGPGCTPTIEGDFLYVIGAGGDVACLKLSDGSIVWQRNMAEDFEGRVPTWRYNESPLIDGQKLICTPGATDATIVALNKKTGDLIWKGVVPEPAPEENNSEGRPGGGRNRRPSSGAGYSSAIAVDIEGVHQYIQFTGTTLAGFDADSGKLLWKYDQPANRMRINCSTPIYQDGLVFAASAYGNGGGAAKVTKEANGEFKAEEVYFTRNMQNHHGGMIVLDGVLYGAAGGNEGGFLVALDFQTGEVLWRDRDAPKGSLAYADGRLYLRSEGGTILLIEPSRTEFVQKGRFEQPDRTDKPAWVHPVIANGKLYIRDQDTLYCYDVKSTR